MRFELVGKIWAMYMFHSSRNYAQQRDEYKAVDLNCRNI